MSITPRKGAGRLTKRHDDKNRKTPTGAAHERSKAILYWLFDALLTLAGAGLANIAGSIAALACTSFSCIID